MLALQLKSGDYLTIGDDIAVQVFQQNGAAFRVEVKAPREVPILRGTLHEKSGGDRPDGLLTRKPSQPSRRIHNAKNLEAMARRKSALMEMQQNCVSWGRASARPLLCYEKNAPALLTWAGVIL